MKQITEITTEPKQVLTLIGEKGEEIKVELRYMPTQQSWFMNLTYGDFVINSIKLVVTPRLLRQWNLPFDIAITSNDGEGVYYRNDFTSERCSFVLMTEEEAQEVEELIYE